MKTLSNKIYKLILFCIIITISSCQEEFEENTNQETKSAFGKVTLDQIPEIKRAIDEKKNNINGKENASIYLNIINPENIKTFTDSIGHTSYTFSLNIEETNQLTNLLITETDEGLKYFLIQYTSNRFQQWIQDINNNVRSNIPVESSFENLDATVPSTSKCMRIDEIIVCQSGQHSSVNSDLEFCDLDPETQWITTYNLSVTNCGGGDGVTIPNGGGGGIDETDTIADPCETLTNAKNEAQVATAINFLKVKTQTKQEFAYEIERQRADYALSGASYNTIAHAGSNYGVVIPTGGYIQGQAHNHPINGIAIPSWEDIYWTQLCEEDNTNFNSGSAFNIIVSPDPSSQNNTILYSITIDDIMTLQQATSAMFNLPEILNEPDSGEKRKKIMKIFDSKFAAMQNNTADQEKTFLKTYTSYGISLSKFNDNTGKWEKLKLDPSNSNNVIPEPCN